MSLTKIQKNSIKYGKNMDLIQPVAEVKKVWEKGNKRTMQLRKAYQRGDE
jgi:hypothetical protein